MNTHHARITTLVVGLLGLTFTSAAQVQTIPSADRGFYNDLGEHSPSANGYRIGNSAADDTRRGFFTFDLAPVQGPVTSATLMLWNPNPYQSADPTERLELHDVSTTLTSLLDGTGGLVCYDDLATGTLFGDYDLSSADNGQKVLVPLNAAGLAALNAALGGDLALGAAIATLDADPLTSEYCFADTGTVDGAAQLILETDTVVLPWLDRGWYNELGVHNPTNVNYIVGNSTCSGCTDEFRNWFVFDMAPVGGLVTGATLSLDRRGYTFQSPFEAYQLVDVTTPVAGLMAGTAGMAAFDDLAAGAAYGGFLLGPSSTQTHVQIPLDHGGLIGANAAGTGLFALGGSITTLDANTSTPEFLFGGSGVSPDVTELVLEVQPQWAYEGDGLPGFLGKLPFFTAQGELLGNDDVTLQLDDARGFSTGYLVIGVSLLGAPFKQGTLVPSPDIVLAGLPIDPTGSATVGFTWPPGLPSGASVWWQWWIVDSAGPAGFSASNGLRCTTP